MVLAAIYIRASNKATTQGQFYRWDCKWVLPMGWAFPSAPLSYLVFKEYQGNAPQWHMGTSFRHSVLWLAGTCVLLFCIQADRQTDKLVDRNGALSELC